MKTELCNFSGFKIYPGHGIRYVPCIAVQSTRPVFIFIDRKNRILFNKKKNPRKIRWTQLYRRQHKKGTVEEIKKKRARRAVKTAGARGIAGISVEAIRAKRNMTAEQRAADREKHLKAAQEKKKALNAKKAEEKKKQEALQKAAAQKAAQKAARRAQPKGKVGKAQRR
eukprot:GEZU01029157.1.p1 GENE.GEZU01029157.1~~GEZU01029157.1.p1  ORF type:complete len:169 (-),score=84.60 GEZU01029157.1:152-658(-)